MVPAGLGLEKTSRPSSSFKNASSLRIGRDFGLTVMAGL